MRKKLLHAALAAGLSLLASRADARTVRDEPYSLDTTWNAAIRMVRVDYGFVIDERDRDMGYFTFQYREGRRTMPGSMEILRAEVDGRQGARIIMQIPSMPAYVESMMLTRLTRKLRSEFGEPPPRPAPTPPAPAQPPAGTPPSDGTPAQPQQPAQQSQTPVLSRGRWEPPPHIRSMDDLD